METVCSSFGSGIALAEAVGYSASFLLMVGLGVLATWRPEETREALVELVNDEGDGAPAVAARPAFAG